MGGITIKWMFTVSLLSVAAICHSEAKLVPIIPAGGFQISFRAPGANVLDVVGTWVIVDDPTGDRIADPINLSKMLCIKADKQCIEDFAYIEDNKRLDLDKNYWTIISWTDNEITATDDSSACRSLTLTINWKTKEVFKITKNGGSIPEKCVELGPKLGIHPLSRPRIAKLMAPYDAMQADSRTRK